MKFVRLYLKAFGPFRDRFIDLPTGAGNDFHVIFGPNEAGKSTILRAVTGFLFGIPERTGDAFLHDYSALRVGATLLLPDGSRLSAMRRKARKATLFAIDEATGAEVTERPLQESTASDLVGGLDLGLYQNLFGLDLNGLVSGSEELLRGEGEVGRSLFQAAAGLASLRAVIADLDEEAATTFKARGSTGHLNRALNDFDEQRRVLKDATVRTYVWETAEREHRQDELKHAQLREALKDKRSEQQRLQRIRANLPLLAERAVKREEAESHAHIPLLPSEAAQLRAAAQERLRSAEEAKQAAEARLAQLDTTAVAMFVREGVLEQASAIEQVFHAIESYRLARDSVPRLARESADLSERIRKLLVEIGSPCGVAQASELLPPETLVSRVQSLIDEHGRHTDREEQLPYGLDVVENLANKVLPEIARRLSDEIAGVQIDLEPFAALKGRTFVGQMVAGLSAKTDPDEVRRLAQMTPEETSTLGELQKTLAEADPRNKAKAIILSAQRIEELVKRIDAAEAWVSDAAVAKLKELDDGVLVASQAEKVIVLTHDTTFLGEIRDAIEQAGVDHQMHHLEWKDNRPGFVVDGLPWAHKSYKERIDRLEKAHKDLEKRWSAYPGDAEASDMRHQYDFLRATIERVVQDLVLNGVVQRYRDWIRVDNLDEVVGFEVAEHKEITHLYSRCCDVVDAHDPASAKNAPVPSPQELHDDLDALKSVIALIRARRAKAKQQPTAATVPGSAQSMP